MLFRGSYDAINGVRRPYVTVQVRTASGAWIPLPFLIDSGADATFLDASCVQQLGINLEGAPQRSVSGVGGQVSHVQFSTALRFESPEGAKTFTGTIGVFMNQDACDTPVLGRDVLDNFRLVFDKIRDCILLLSAPHDYDVVVRS